MEVALHVGLVHELSDFIKTFLGCGNVVLAPSDTTSSEISIRASRTVAERASSFGICLAKTLLNLVQAPINQQKAVLKAQEVCYKRLLK